MHDETTWRLKHTVDDFKSRYLAEAQDIAEELTYEMKGRNSRRHLLYLEDDSELETLLTRMEEMIVQLGGVYDPAAGEKKRREINRGILSASRIEFTVGGFFGGEQSSTVTFHDGSAYFVVEDTGDGDLELSAAPVERRMPQDEFMAGLKRLNLSAWRKSYDDYAVMDGESWSLTIYFSDGDESFSSRGSNAYPENFSRLTKLLRVPRNS